MSRTPKLHVVCLLALFLMIGAVSSRSANITQTDCSKVSDADIVKAVQEKIKADSQFNDQWKHINVSSKDRVVTLSGWTNGKDAVNTLVKYARSANCVKSVKNNLSPVRKEGCGQAQKRCGDICIGDDEQCNLMME